MKAQFQINIPKRASSCNECALEFSAGQEILSVLNEENEEWQRKDICSACEAPKTSAVLWKHVIGSEVKTSPDVQEDMVKMLQLLQQLIESPHSFEHEEAYLLALYLVRKKMLVHRVRMGWYENLETGEMYVIPKIDFSHFSAKAAQIRLQGKL